MEDLPSALDVAVIGGGISGLGVALEAAKAGLEVGLFEKGKLSKATSANSLRIIHGGLRYLQALDLVRIAASMTDQAYWLKEAPRYIKSVPCLLPLERFGLRSRLPLGCAAFFYNGLSFFLCGKANGARLVSKSYVAQQAPVLGPIAPYGALLWFDALLEDPEGFASYLAGCARRFGAGVYEDTEVCEIRRVGRKFSLHCRRDSKTHALSTKVVVNASGPWLNKVKEEGCKFRTTHPRFWCKAFNVILNDKLESRYAFGVRGEGRFYFFVPRRQRTALGTWYVPFSGDLENIVVEEGEVMDFLESVNRALPSFAFGLKDVESVECGILPMLKHGRRGPVLYGAERLNDCGGFIDVLSTKYTTFRHQALRVMQLIRPYLADQKV